MDSRFFKKWFADSKVVDAYGDPLVVYHGTLESFTEFDPSMADPASGIGLWFTDSSEWGGRGGFDRATPSYLNLHNPLEVDFEGRQHDYSDVRDAVNRAKSMGRDGLIIRNIEDGGIGTDQYVAFHPNQIKSATGNQGTFDSEKPGHPICSSCPSA